MERKASDLFVECLEVEGVEYVFGIPGEETLDLNESLANSSVDFIPVRHEQGGAYMADMYGRLTQRAGVCLGTLGPGATNLVTGIADAFLDRSPLVALTGQGDLERMHKESHQYIDVVSLMKPVTKWNARVNAPAHHPRGRAQGVQGRAGPEARPDAHRAARGRDGGDGRRRAAAGAHEHPQPRALRPGAAEGGRGHPLGASTRSCWPATASRASARRRRCASSRAPPGSAWPRRSWARACSTTRTRAALGTVGLQSRDYALAGFEDADVVITVGYDLVEHSPENWNPKKDKKIVCIDTASVEVDEYFMTECDLIGDLYHILTRLAEELRDAPHEAGDSRLNDIVLGRFESAKDDDAFPMQPPRALWEIRQALGREDMLISDVGLHKLWIARMFPAHEPNTVLIANGLAGMGIALPTAIAAKLVHPDRKVVTVNGDGGFLMNCQELETAVRLKTPIVNVIWENSQFGSIVWKQDKKFGRHFGTDFTNPDFVKLADAFGMPAWRCERTEDFGHHLRHALTLDLPSLIVLPIDYSIDVTISEELGTETVAA